MPCSCCSIICVVVLSSVVASAPGKAAVTPICGGASAGNWAIGSERADNNPNKQTRIARTQAKIGRSMKKRDIDRSVAGRDAPGDDPAGAGGAVCLDHSKLGHVVVARDDDGWAATLVAADGALGNEDATRLNALGNRPADEHAGEKQV